MSDTHVQGFDAVARADGHSNPLALVDKVAGRASLLSRRDTSAYQDRLSAS